MERLFVIAGSVLGLLAVAAGAFGKHSLQGRLDPATLETFDTAARYQLIHALALVAAAWVAGRFPGPAAVAAGWSFLFGTIVFSGSLYLLVATGAKWLGAITPLGGLGLLAGWACLALAALRG